MAVAAIAVLSSCSGNNDTIFDEGGKQQSEAKVFTATIESDGLTSRTTINREAGDNYNKVSWCAGDEISINGVTYTATPNGTDASKATFAKKTAGDADPTATYKACYPATMSSNGTTFSLPATYTYAAGKFNMPMYAYNTSSKELSFKNLCGVLAITVPTTQLSTVSTVTVSSDQQLNGAFTATEAGVLTFESKTLEDADKKITLTVASGGSGNVFYIPVPAGSHTLEVAVSDGTTTKKMTTSTAVTVARNTIYNIVFAVVTPFLPGLFTVNGSGKQVQFTKSNLYWNGSAFKFEAKQTDYQTTWDANHVSHLFWTKSAAASYAQNYGDGTNATNDVPFFAESQGGLTVEGTSGLYVLTIAEWNYLLNSRTNATSLRKPEVTVGSATKCLIIAPDGFTSTLQSSYTLDEVNTLGLVCLPAAGERAVTTFNYCGSYGYYWSATPNSSDMTSARYLLFGQNIYDDSDYRYRGLILRLVATAQ